jgi:hypothetical protein
MLAAAPESAARVNAITSINPYRPRKSLATIVRGILIEHMKKLRMNLHSLPPRPTGGVSGTGFDVKFFPASNSGRTGAFTPMPIPANGDFPAWVEFYVNLIGDKLEKLNALQFNLDDVAGGIPAQMTTELGALADALKIGSGKSPTELRWPLAGSYIFAWSIPDAGTIGFSTFVIDLFFEADRDYHMVVNCEINMHAKAAGPPAPISSSSSYLATSSSG